MSNCTATLYHCTMVVLCPPFYPFPLRNPHTSHISITSRSRKAETRQRLLIVHSIYSSVREGLGCCRISKMTLTGSDFELDNNRERACMSARNESGMDGRRADQQSVCSPATIVANRKGSGTLAMFREGQSSLLALFSVRCTEGFPSTANAVKLQSSRSRSTRW